MLCAASARSGRYGREIGSASPGWLSPAVMKGPAAQVPMPDREARAAILVKILRRHGCAAVDPALLSGEPVDGSSLPQLQVRPSPPCGRQRGGLRSFNRRRVASHRYINSLTEPWVFVGPAERDRETVHCIRHFSLVSSRPASSAFSRGVALIGCDTLSQVSCTVCVLLAMFSQFLRMCMHTGGWAYK